MPDPNRAFPLTAHGEGLIANLAPGDLGFTPARVWNPSPSVRHRTEPYRLPMKITIGIHGTAETGAKFSPPPYAVVVEGKSSSRTQGEAPRALLVVAADAGWHRWSAAEFHTTARAAEVSIDLEGQTDPLIANKHICLHVIPALPGETNMALLARGLAMLYPSASSLAPRGLTRRPRNPAWWSRPIYCGWGDQVALMQHLEGPGPESRTLAYCLQGLYERWVARLDEARVPVGTIAIDAGWSPAGTLVPHDDRWPDLRGFIDRQHRRGRRVLLWLGTWQWDGLPDEWCVFAGDFKLCANPDHPGYRDYLRRQVTKLISADGFNADGFKIDQLAYVPTVRRPRGGPRFGRTQYLDDFQGELRPKLKNWGTELLLQLQKDIYDAAHAAKPDALVTSSTVHPIFRDTLDMARLHDMGHVAPDIFAAMKARSDLSEAALPGKLIDTDDWVHTDYDLWLRYTSGSHVLGVPCIFYAERFVAGWKKMPLTREIPLTDLRRIAAAWRKAI